MEKVQVKNNLGRVYYETYVETDGNFIMSDWIGYVTVDEVKKLPMRDLIYSSNRTELVRKCSTAMKN